MRIAVFSTRGNVGEPGEAEEIAIYEGSHLLDRYPNPALSSPLRAIAAFGVLASRGVDSVIVAGIGRPAFEYGRRRFALYVFRGSEKEAIQKLMTGELEQAKAPTSEGKHRESSSRLLRRVQSWPFLNEFIFILNSSIVYSHLQLRSYFSEKGFEG